jgi:hypothetical protein
MSPVKYREIIADQLHAEGWSYGIAEHLTKHGLLFCVDARVDYVPRCFQRISGTAE